MSVRCPCTVCALSVRCSCAVRELSVHCPCTVRALSLHVRALSVHVCALSVCCPCTFRALSMQSRCTVRAHSVHCPIYPIQVTACTCTANRIHSIQQWMHGRSTQHQGRHHTLSVFPISGRTFRPRTFTGSDAEFFFKMIKRAHLFVTHIVLQKDPG
jgi:hypothetical protein